MEIIFVPQKHAHAKIGTTKCIYASECSSKDLIVMRITLEWPVEVTGVLAWSSRSHMLSRPILDVIEHYCVRASESGDALMLGLPNKTVRNTA